MAIDTADKRSSIIGQGIIPLMIPPIPDAGMSKADRRHASALYRGIDTATVAMFRWIPEQDSSSTFRCEQDSASTYRCEQDSSSSWSQQVDTDED